MKAMTTLKQKANPNWDKAMMYTPLEESSTGRVLVKKGSLFVFQCASMWLPVHSYRSFYSNLSLKRRQREKQDPLISNIEGSRGQEIFQTTLYFYSKIKPLNYFF